MEYSNLFRLYNLFKLYASSKIDSKSVLGIFKKDFGEEFVNLFFSQRTEEEVATSVILDDINNRSFFHKSLSEFFNATKITDEKTKEIFKKFSENSYCSVFRVLSNNANGSFVEDLLRNKKFFIYLPEDFALSEYSYIRVSQEQDTLYFLEFLNELDVSFAHVFASFLQEFINRKKSLYPKDNALNKLDFISTIKFLQPEIFFHYTILFKQKIDMEIDEEDFKNFQDFLDSILDKKYQDSYLNMLDDILDNNSKYKMEAEEVNYYFENFKIIIPDLKFSDFKKLNFKDLYQIASENGIFSKDEEITNSIKIFKLFYKKMKHIFHLDVNNILSDLDDILNELFKYKNISQNSFRSFYVDDKLVDIINNNDLAYLLTGSFDDFCEFSEYSYMNKLKSGELSTVVVKKIAHEMGLTPTKYVKNFREHHFPIIRMFREFAELKKILTYHEDKWQQYYELDKTAFRYLRLESNEKTAIWLNVLSKEKFYERFLNKKDFLKYRDFIFELLLKTYNDEIFVNKNDNFKFLIEFLMLLEIIDTAPKDDSKKIPKDNLSEDSYIMTNFGKSLLNYFNFFNKDSNVIKVDFK